MQIIAAFLFPTQVKPPDDSQVISHFGGYLITIAASVMGLLSGTFPRLSKWENCSPQAVIEISISMHFSGFWI